jgi:hypothetical protein
MGGELSRQAVVTTLVIVAFCAFLLWPVTTLNCPRWEVWVVDKNGDPLRGVTVRLHYQDYSAEDDEHEVSLTTDDRGYVVFPAQELTASRWKRLLTMLKSASAGVHASFGPHPGFPLQEKDSKGSLFKANTSWTGRVILRR